MNPVRLLTSWFHRVRRPQEHGSIPESDATRAWLDWHHWQFQTHGCPESEWPALRERLLQFFREKANE